MIHVLAIIELKEGKREAFLDEFRKIIPEVRREKGCIEYGPAVDAVTDISAQRPVRENVVTIIEKWETLAHLKEHLAAPHMQAYRLRVKDLIERTELAILQSAE